MSAASFRSLYNINRFFMVAVWLINGLYCKILGEVPRHQMIVAKILGQAHSQVITIAIGISEVIMAVWIAIGFYRKMNAVAQMVIVGVMNALEFFLARELLLWGSANALFACMFIGFIYFNEFRLNQ